MSEVPLGEVLCGIDSYYYNGNICGLSWKFATIENKKDRSKEIPRIITRYVDVNHRKHPATEHFETRANGTRWPRSSELRKNKEPFKLREIRYKIQEKAKSEGLAGI